MAQGATITTPAKINLSLRVLGRRADGYHEIESVVAAVDLCDELRAEAREESGVELVCSHPRVPRDGRNLVCRAADLLARRFSVRPAVRVELRKRIPVGAGLGGGSSDGAAALLLLAEHWGVWPGEEELSRMAAELGSDVPFFLVCGTAVITGRGEQVERLEWGLPGWVVVMMPEVELSTAAVYAAWREGDGGAGASRGWWRGGPESVGRLNECCGNDLLSAAERVAPGLRQVRESVVALGVRGVHLSGSGSAMFALTAERGEAEAWAERVRTQLGVGTYVGRYFGAR